MEILQLVSAPLCALVTVGWTHTQDLLYAVDYLQCSDAETDMCVQNNIRVNDFDWKCKPEIS